MSEAPERIYIGILYADESSSIYTVGMEKDTDVEYIRKDIYDAHSIVNVDRYDKCKLIAQNNAKDRVIQENAKDVQGLKLGLHKAQERINQLEEALRFYADEDDWDAPMGGGHRNIFRDGETIYFNGFDVARKALGTLEDKNKLKEWEPPTEEHVGNKELYD